MLPEHEAILAMARGVDVKAVALAPLELLPSLVGMQRYVGRSLGVETVQ